MADDRDFVARADGTLRGNGGAAPIASHRTVASITAILNNDKCRGDGWRRPQPMIMVLLTTQLKIGRCCVREPKPVNSAEVLAGSNPVGIVSKPLIWRCFCAVSGPGHALTGWSPLLRTAPYFFSPSSWRKTRCIFGPSLLLSSSDFTTRPMSLILLPKDNECWSPIAEKSKAAVLEFVMQSGEI
jgi:hypothetical protein